MPRSAVSFTGRARLPALALILGFNAVCSGALAPAARASSVPSFGHVFVIVGENKSLSQITSSNAPYTMNTLRPESAWFTNYHSVTGGSLADYVALTSGQYAACETKGPCGAQNVPSIFSQVGNGSWKDWSESMPSSCDGNDAGSDSTLNAYKAGHNPALYFSGLPCSTDDVAAGTTGRDDMSYFNEALAAGTVPRYNFIAPNLCEDGHDACNGADEVTEYDDFLQREIPMIEASPSFGSNGVIFATYDEGSSTSTVMMAVVGPQVQPGTYSGDYDHYSTVASIEQGLGLPCLANACAASALPIAAQSPRAPSVSISQPTNGSTVSGQVTVAGTAVAQGGASIKQVQVSVDNGAPQTATGTTNWSATIDTSGMSNGPHTITATATDTNNLTATASVSVNVGYAGGTSCPAVPSGATEHSQNVSVEGSQTGWGPYDYYSKVTRVEPAGGAYDGLWALQIGLDSGAGQAGVTNANPMWVTSTTQGTEYTGIAFVRASVPGEQVGVLIAEKTSSGTKLGSANTFITLNDTAWHQVSASYTASGTGNLLHYSLHAYLTSPSQYFLADCLSLQSP